VATNGNLTLLNGPMGTCAGPIDLALSPDNGYLYSLCATAHTIDIFEVNADGSLTQKPTLSGVTQRAAGLVVR
jgi:hypothetical protein